MFRNKLLYNPKHNIPSWLSLKHVCASFELFRQIIWKNLQPIFPCFYNVCGNICWNLPETHTRESWFSPLVKHCVHFHCVFMHMSFYDDPANTKRVGLNRKNHIYMPTRKCVRTYCYCLFFFFHKLRNPLWHQQEVTDLQINLQEA